MCVERDVVREQKRGRQGETEREGERRNRKRRKIVSVCERGIRGGQESRQKKVHSLNAMRALLRSKFKFRHEFHIPVGFEDRSLIQ